MGVSLKNFDKFEQRLANLRDRSKDVSDRTVAVGVQGDGQLALIATVQEYGTVDGRIPSRPFMRIAIGKPELVTFVRKQAGDYFGGKTSIETALGRIGAFAKGLVQRVIASNIPPENKPSTIKQKGSSSTLIDTGRLRQSISWVVRSARIASGK